MGLLRNWRLCWEEVSEMVRFYLARIRDGKMLLEDVPVRWRDRVREAMEEEGN